MANIADAIKPPSVKDRRRRLVVATILCLLGSWLIGKMPTPLLPLDLLMALCCYAIIVCFYRSYRRAVRQQDEYVGVEPLEPIPQQHGVRAALPQPPAPLPAHVYNKIIRLRQAEAGSTVKVHRAQCPRCKGVGYSSSQGERFCDFCKGRGHTIKYSAKEDQ